MRQWLTIEFVLGLLLVTSFTCNGLVALWAATSPRHWFLRIAAVVTFLSPLLFVPAYESFVAFTLQAAVVMAGVTIARWWRAQQSQAEAHGLRPALHTVRLPSVHFSLTTILLLTVPIAAAVLLFTRLPALNQDAWISIVLDGVVAGVVTLISVWIASSRRKFIAWPVGITLCLLLGALPAWFDWFAPSVVAMSSDWPPDNKLTSLLGPLDRPVAVWLAVVPIFAFTLATLLLVWCGAFGKAAGSDCELARLADWRLKRFRQAAFAALVILAALFPLAVLRKLLTPEPIPRVALPDPNGYEDLIAAGQMINSPILDQTREPKSTDELATEIAKFAVVFERIQLGLSRPCEAPIWPADGDVSKLDSMHLPYLQVFRADARALMRKAQLAQQQGRFDDAANAAVDCMRLGQVCGRGGLLTHYLVGLACEGIGDSAFYPSVQHLDASSCRRLIAALQKLEVQRESLDEVRHRDRIWDENAYGWHGHLTNLLGTYVDTVDTNRIVKNTLLLRQEAITRMLIVELALRCYQLEHNMLPQNLEQLIPNILAQIPTDPFDGNNRPLRYQRTADDCVLYSVGPNGVDDGGAPCAKDDNPGMPETGDLRIDTYFAQIDENNKRLSGADSNKSNSDDPDQSATDAGDR
jgi:hypothetical protein